MFLPLLLLLSLRLLPFLSPPSTTASPIYTVAVHSPLSFFGTGLPGETRVIEPESVPRSLSEDQR